jgi:putative ABC transport system permease protein
LTNNLLQIWHPFSCGKGTNLLLMLANYYKTAVRHIARSRFHSLINVIGLSTGIAFTLLIAAYCWTEKQVNHQLRHADRQYFLTSVWKDPNLGLDITTAGQLAKALKDNYPSLVANYYRWDGITSAVSCGDKHFREGIQMGDSTLLTMYGLPLAYGDAQTALNEPFSVVITEEKAVKFFGRTDVVGKELVIDNFSGGRQPFRITGVMKQPGRNSVTYLNDRNDNGVFVPASNLAFFGRNMDWANNSIPSYIELQPGVKPQALDAPIAHLLKVNTNPFVQANLRVIPVRLTDYYLETNKGSVKKMLFTLSMVAIFILGMAMINFINLSVSRSSLRLREIGIRKVLGGLRRQLRMQFLTESLVLAVASTVVALLVYGLAKPWFSGMLGSALPSLAVLPPAAWGLIGLFALVTGWLAGLYPAILLSSLSSIEALRNKAGSEQERVILRKGLVGFQFGTAAVVLIAAIIISQQINLFFSDSLGYNKEYVISAQLPRDWSMPGMQRMSAVRDVLARLPEVKDITLTWNIPNGMEAGGLGVYRPGGDSTKAVNSMLLVGDEHYASTYQIPLLAGVFFNAPNEPAAQDASKIVLSESEVRALGWQRPGDAINQPVRLFGLPNAYTVSGVTKDFHFTVMGSPIRPTVFMHQSGSPFYRYFALKLRPGNIGTTVEALQKAWGRLMPGAPFEYTFMDDTLHGLYNTELRLRKAATAATVLVLVIVLLGVVGLVSGAVQRRAKEIAIRKVIGASVRGIVQLFITEYLPVLFVAGIVASPLAWWLMQQWLDNYATKITLTPWPFVGAIGVLVLSTVVVIVAQTLRAALADPVRALRSE